MDHSGSGSVRRDLGSALERAEEGSEGAPTAEVQSRAAGDGEGGARLGGWAAQRVNSGRRVAPAVPGTPAEPPVNQPDSPLLHSAGQQSSLSAGGDPAVPFSVPPTTQRRFAQRSDGPAGAATGRRWAWRRDSGAAVAAGGRAGAAAGGGGVSVFQRARAASAGRHDAAAGPEPAGSSATSSTCPPQPEPPSRLSAADDHAAGLPPLPLVLHGSAGSEGVALRSGSIDASRPLPPQRSALLRPTLSLMDSAGLPSPAEQQGGAVGAMVAEALLRELRRLAALESAVYLAGGRRAFQGGAARQLLAPARRLARTIISLGPREGLAFGLHAIAAIQAVAGAASGDMHRLTFWWSNALQLRVQLSALCHSGALHARAAPVAGAGSEPEQRASELLASPRELLAASAVQPGAGAGLDWMQASGWCRALLPRLHELEAWLFAEMTKHLWWRVLLHSVTQTLQQATSGGGSGVFAAAASAAAAGGQADGVSHGVAPLAPTLSAASEVANPTSLQGTPRSFETPEEEALQRWLEGLAAVERAVRQPGRPPAAPRAHLALLHRQLILALLRRLDTLLFRRLLLDDGEERVPLRGVSMSGRDAFSRVAEADEVLGAGAEAAAVGLLAPALLPYARGALTFGTGVSLKMAVSRLGHWAADCGAGRSTDCLSDYRLFPCLRATADLLMMPKGVHFDPHMRRELVPGLPLHRVCQLLERFQPDDNAPDPLPPGLLEALLSESPRSDGGSTPSPTTRPEEEYVPPPEAALLADGVVEPMSLEMDEGSDEELEALAGLQQHGGGGFGGGAAAGDEAWGQRFALLRDLWASAH